MKKRTFLKRAAIIAVSTVMAAGVALTAAACGGGGGGGGGTNELGYKAGVPGRGTDPNKLTVYIFCNESDTMANKQICDEWMAEYNEAHGTHYSVAFDSLDNKSEYFDNVDKYWSAGSTGNMYDVYYLAPRFVRTYGETGSALNLADYFDTVSADPSLSGEAAKTANEAVLGQIWKNAASYYAYIRGQSRATADKAAYQLGQPVSYDAEKNGFYTDATGEEVGLYGLPKDYSNFSTSYNKIFFSDEMKEALTTTLPDATRNVKGASNETTGSVASERTYNANTGRTGSGMDAKPIIRYAVDVTAEQSHDGKAHVTGDAAPIINPGIPTAYFPFNFFRFNNYDAALAGGDPLALFCEAYTNGQGYIVTIPGFPNDELKVDAKYADANAPYDTSIGHVTYTYAEYSAFLWAMTYYLNTFDGQPFPGGETDGFGGTSISGEPKTVFGGEQYEGNSGGAVGSVLYLLPWLFSNDADLVNAVSALCTVRESGKAVGEGATISDASGWRDFVGQATDAVSKLNLDGTTRTVNVQYGFNSERFIEAYGAFLALASDWNANNGGDSDSAGDNNGWAYFRAGRCLVYGSGSWDGATRNDTHPDVLEFGLMPTPVSEDYALYSSIKGANYTMETYSNGATEKGTGNGAANDRVQRPNLADGKKVYSKAEILANQILRQDKWGARMDSVGYAVNGQVSNYTGEHAWKEEAAVSLVMRLTIDRASQVALTYAGAQYPNFRDQMEQFVNYQKAEYKTTGAFKDMITPEGFASMDYYKADGTVDTAVAEKAKALWDSYYDVAMDMEVAVRAAKADKTTTTVAQYLADKKDSEGNAIKYDEAYKDALLTSFTGSTTTSFLAYAMKVLRMIPMSRVDREIVLREQYGLNAVRDSTMYTYNDTWLSDVDARGALDTMFAYTRGQQVKVGGKAINGTRSDDLETLRNGIKQNPAQSGTMWETPVVYCLRLAQTEQTKLSEAVQLEANALAKLGKK